MLASCAFSRSRVIETERPIRMSSHPDPIRDVQATELHALRQRLAKLEEELRIANKDRLRVQREMELSSNELMHANAELRAVFTSLPDLFLRVDARGMVVDHKGGGADALNHLLEPDPWNVPVEKCIVAGAAQAIECVLEMVSTGQAAARIEYTLGEDSALRHFGARAVQLPNRDTLIAIEEVTEQMRAHLALLSEQKDRAHELRSFAAAASHDLRAPLRNIDIIAEWIEEDVEDAGATRAHVALLRKRVKHMDDLLSGVLEYAQAGAQRMSPTESVDTLELAMEIADLVTPPEFNVVARNLPTLTTGRGPLERVLLNLITNAIKHHDKSTGRIVIECQEQADFVIYRVSDDGPGIPEKDRERALSMFRKLGRQSQDNGAGMGLALVRRIVTRIGGDIRLEANEPRGLRVLVKWPRQWPHRPSPSSLPPSR